MKCAIVK